MTTVQIDQDIWLPFMAAYPAYDADLVASTYSADLIHAGGPGATAKNLDGHMADMRAFFDYARSQGDAFAIEFRFTQRILGEGVASERGVFRIDVLLATGGERQSYGYFHVFERLEPDGWRILTDFDEPGATPEEFEAAEAIG